MKRTNESGRSMVEMLGVLAIIGVLSVGGIAGYTMAMNRYRSNEIIDMANKLAVVAFSARETYMAMHNGDTIPTSDVPDLASSGLYTSSVINGATFETPTFYSDTTCTTPIVASTKNQSARSIKIVINFNGNDNVCKAAASTLGEDCSGGKVEFCSRAS